METRQEFIEYLGLVLPMFLGLLTLSFGVVAFYLRQLRVLRSIRGKYLDDLENERHQLSMEMHDIYGPYSMIIRNKLHNLSDADKDKLDEIDDVIDKLSTELMLKNQELFPVHLMHEEFKTSLEHLAAKLSNEVCSIDLDYEAKADVPRAKKIHLYRVISELMFNALKHAKPDFIQLSVSGDESQMEFELYYRNPNGKSLRINRKRQGQSIIKERLQRINAKHSISFKDQMMTESIKM